VRIARAPRRARGAPARRGRRPRRRGPPWWAPAPSRRSPWRRLRREGERRRKRGRGKSASAGGRPPVVLRIDHRSIDRAGKRTSLARLDLAGQGLCGTKEEGGNARQLGSPRRKRRARATAVRATATIDQSRWLRSFATATTSTTRAKIARFEMPGAGTHWRRAPWTWRGTCKPFLRCEVCECSFERVRDYADRRARRPRFGCGLAASGQ